MFRRDEKIVDLIWSPTKDDEFLAFDSDIYFFKVKSSRIKSSDNTIPLCDETNAELMLMSNLNGNFNETLKPRIISWYPGSDNPYQLAIYASNQKFLITNINNHHSGRNGSKNIEIVKEYSFKPSRNCSNLCWNPVQMNLIAAGLAERHRNDQSVLVWDVKASGSKLDANNAESIIHITTFQNQPESSSISKALHSLPSTLSTLTTNMNIGTISNVNDSVRLKPTFQAVSERCFSLQWNHHKNNSLLVGISKNLKVFDISSGKNSVMSVNTKYIYGFSSSPNDSEHLAISYLDDEIALWDLRKFSQPINIFKESDSIYKLQWCPTKCGKLASILKNSNTVNIYSMRTIENSIQSYRDDENDPFQMKIEKPTKHYLPERRNITNFCWYNFDYNKILVLSDENLKTISLSQTFALTWSPDDVLYWSSNLAKVIQADNFDFDHQAFMDDFKEKINAYYGIKYDIITINNGNATQVSSYMNPSVAATVNNSIGNFSSSAVPLALTLYASCLTNSSSLIRVDFNYNIKLSESSRENPFNVKYLWQWFESVNRFFEITIPLNPRNTQIEIPVNSRNFIIDLYWTRYCGLTALLNEFINKRPSSSEHQQNHDDRFKAIAYYLCGWEYKDNSISRQFFSILENSNQFERACCLALLTQNYDQALEIMDNATKTVKSYGCIWIALKYFSEDFKQKQSLAQQQGSKPVLSHQSSLNMSSPSIIKNQSSPSTHSSLTNSAGSNKSQFYILNSSIESTPKLNISSTSSDLFARECNRLIDQFNNPYLKAMFNYLINKEEAIPKILYDRDILFQDRIALAVYFLFNQHKQHELLRYFETVTEDECLKYANLNGILLTGLSRKSLDLFQSYIDITNDIQTVCLAIIHTPYSDIIQSKQVQYWLNSYRDLLNRLKLWERRAEFDILKMKLIKSVQHCLPNTTVSNQTSSSNDSNNYFNIETNLSSSSSSSFTSNNHSNLVQLSTPSQFQRNQKPFLNTNQLGLHSSNRQLASIIRKNTPLTVNILCNNCGRELADKNQDNHNLSSQTNIPYNQQISINTRYNSNNNFLKNASINGCVYCSKFLPQCIICLRLMKINLSPTPINNIQTQANLYNSQMFQSNLISIQNFKNSKNKIQPFQIKFITSPNSVNNIQNSNYLNTDTIRKQDDKETLINIKLINRLGNDVHQQNESLIFLETCKFGNWFSWCQSCKHGGHIKHIIDWFKYHNKCPFYNCECNCVAIDYLY